jgi:DNA ligase-1
MLPNKFKPQLAIDFNKVKTQPKNQVMSVKIDGIRCMIFGGKAYSRTLKLIPNLHIQKWAEDNAEMLEGLDGELIVGDLYAPDVFTNTTSFVMSIAKVQEFKFYAFDLYCSDLPWITRFSNLCGFNLPENVVVLRHVEVTDQVSIDTFEQECLAKGAEGIMLRDADASYKCGRSGTINPELQKVKRFNTEEFKVVGYEPLYINENAAQTNELGRTSRSTSKDGLRAVERLGALKLVTADGLEFTAGSGLNDAARDELWEKRDQLVGQMASIKFFAVGEYTVPRFPILRGIRDMIDL